MKSVKQTMHQNIILINKPQGQTPLQAIEQLKEQKPEYQNIKIGYAGRLDPMADGLLLLLLGNENKNREKYQQLSKEYNFTVLFGVATDTYDLLGKLTKVCRTNVNESIVRQAAKQFIGTYNQPYPPYSSKTVNGKPLYFYARENRLNEIKIPTKKVTIESLSYLSSKPISKQNLEAAIFEKIERVDGDFRQKEILKDWKDFFQKTNLEEFLLTNFSISCTCGTYVRHIANEIGKKLNICALAYSITRTRIGEYKID